MNLSRAVGILGGLSGLLASACGSSATATNAATVGDAGPGPLGAICSTPQACASAVCLLFTANAQSAPGICTSFCTDPSQCGGGGSCLTVPVLDGGACFPNC